MADAYKATGWRISAKLRQRLVSYAKGEGTTAENLANKWLEEKLRIEELKKRDQLGKPILEK